MSFGIKPLGSRVVIKKPKRKHRAASFLPAQQRKNRRWQKS